MSQTVNAYSSVLKENNCYPEFGIKTEELIINGELTDRLAIYKNNNLVSIGLTGRYQLIPNESVYQTVKQAVEHIQIEGHKVIPMKPSGSNAWYKEVDDGFFVSNDETRASIAFMLDKKYDFTGNGDYGNVGFFGMSDIIGKSAVKFGTATYRLWCQNQMFHLATSGLNSARIDQVIRKGYARHTKNLNLDVIAQMIEDVLTDSLNIVKKYREWFNTKLSKSEGINIVNAMPKYVLDTVKFGSYDKKSDKYNIDTEISKYEAFNEITRAVTHDSTNYRQALLLMAKVDSILR